MYLIKKVSEISGVSVRTLHHYDEIGLLSPKKAENGYRYYSEEDMSLLQTILFYKCLGFSLKEIKKLLYKNEGELLFHLRNQLALMKKEKQRLLTLIATLEKTIDSQERKIIMSNEEKFKGFKYEDNKKYKQAAIDKYGREVVDNAMDKQKGKEKEVAEVFNEIFFAFADNKSRGLDSKDRENVLLAEKLHKHLCQYAFDCSIDVFSKIGCLYVNNEEFKENLNKYGEGTAQYACDAIQTYVEEQK